MTSDRSNGGGATKWPYAFSRRSLSLKRSVMRELISITARPDIISFAGGLPAPETFPVDDYRACAERVLTREGRQALQYGPPFVPLKEALAEHMRGRGVNASPDNIFITNGAQQGLDLVARLLVDPGSRVVVEEIAFTGIGQAFSAQEAEFATAGTDLAGGTGMDVDLALRHLPGARALIVVPAFHNPLGVTLSAEKRSALVEAARRSRVVIVEDDPYSPLRYEGSDLAALKAMDEPGTRGGILYLGSFSKILAPGVRLGWIVAPRPAREKLTVLKESVDLETSAFTQRTVAEFMQRGLLAPHIKRLRAAYRLRRDAMLAALAREFPEGVTWTRPQGGMFLWVTLPAGLDTAAMLPEAVEREKVAFVPGHAFSVGGSAGRNAMRINFTNASLEMIDEGVTRLGRFLKEKISVVQR